MRIQRQLLSLAAALLLAAPASAQVSGATNTLDNVLMTTPMWSLSDPFGFSVLASATGRVAALELSSQSLTGLAAVIESAGYATTGSVAVVAASALDAYNVGTNAASLASAANAVATNAAALAASVYANSTNALAAAYAANAAAGNASTLANLAYGLAGSYYGYATNALALAAAADAKADAALALISDAADPHTLLARPEAGLYSGYSDLSMANPSVPSNRIYSVYSPTQVLWTANLPNITNNLGNPLAQNGQAVALLPVGSFPMPFVYPVPGGLTNMTMATVSIIPGMTPQGVTLTAVTNAGNVDLFYSTSRHAAPLAYTNLTPLQYTGAVTVALQPLDPAFSGQVSFTVTPPTVVTTLVAVAATKAEVGAVSADLSALSAYVNEMSYSIFGFADPGSSYPGFDLFSSHIAHTNDFANPHRVTAAQTGAVSTNDLALLVDTNELELALAPLVDTNELTAAIAAIPQSDPFIVRDSADTNRWWRFEGTNAVQYELGALTTNYTVTLSAYFMETVTHARPAWTNNVWPFSIDGWVGTDAETSLAISSPLGNGVWVSYIIEYPATLTPLSTEVSQGTATVYQHIYCPTNATGNVIGPIPTNLVTDAGLAAWWVETGATKLDVKEFEDHVNPAITPDPHEGVYLLRAYTNAVPVAGNTLLTLDGTNLTVTGETFAYRAFPTNAYQLGISPTAPAFHYGGTIISTNAVTFATNLLLRGTATVSGTNCFALQPWTNGVWEVLWGGK